MIATDDLAAYGEDVETPARARSRAMRSVQVGLFARLASWGVRRGAVAWDVVRAANGDVDALARVRSIGDAKLTKIRAVLATISASPTGNDETREVCRLAIGVLS